MANHIPHRNLSKRPLFIVCTVVFLLGTLCLFHPVRRQVRVSIQTISAHLSHPASKPFPQIALTGLDPVQRRIISLSQSEYARKPVSYDKTVQKYTQGSNEAWCADYVSWIFYKAGVPFSNPNSDSWRIPGVYTLQDYFRSIHKYRPVGTYSPQPGDVAIYVHGQGHTAIVLAQRGGMITTIGGNESGRLRIDTRPQTGASNYDLVGFGLLVH